MVSQNCTYIYVLINIFMFTAANARWHFETKLRIHSWWCPIHDLWLNKLRTYCFGSITICRPNLQYTFKQMLGLPSRFHISMVFKTKMFKQSKFFFIKTILWIFCHCNRGNKIAREIRFTSLCSQKCNVQKLTSMQIFYVMYIDMQREVICTQL